SLPAAGRDRRRRVLRRQQGHQRRRDGRCVARARPPLPADRGGRRQGPGLRSARRAGARARRRRVPDRPRRDDAARGARRDRRHAAGLREPRRGGRAGRRRRAAGRCGAVVARVCEPGHVPQLRAPRRGVRCGGSPDRRCARRCHGGAMLSLRMPGRGRASAQPLFRRAAPLAGARSADFAMLWVVSALLLTGLVMVYSASIALPDSPRFANYAPTHFLLRHLMAIAVGVGAGLVAFAVPVRQWEAWSKWLFLIGLVLLVIVLIPGVGKSVYGARRWLSLYVFNLQPSELMKLFVVLYAADYTVRKQDHMQCVRKGFLPMGAAVLLVGLLLLLQPDMGA